MCACLGFEELEQGLGALTEIAVIRRPWTSWEGFKVETLECGLVSVAKRLIRAIAGNFAPRSVSAMDEFVTTVGSKTTTSKLQARSRRRCRLPRLDPSHRILSHHPDL